MRTSILADGQTRKLDSRTLKFVARLRGPGIERVIDIGGDSVRVFAHAFAGGILGHRLGDQPRQAGHRPFADERPRVVFVGAFTDRSVTGGTLSPVDLFTRACRPRNRRRRKKACHHKPREHDPHEQAGPDEHRLLTGLHRHANQGVSEEGHVDASLDTL